MSKFRLFMWCHEPMTPTHTHTRTNTLTHIHIYTYMHAHIHTCVHTHTHVMHADVLCLFYRSPEWKRVPSGEKKRMGFTVEDDGEFWLVLARRAHELLLAVILTLGTMNF